MDRKELVWHSSWGIVAGAITLFALGGAELRYADPIRLVNIASLVGGLAVAAQLAIGSERKSGIIFFGVLSAFAFIGVVYFVLNEIAFAGAASAANDLRCRDIQGHMLSHADHRQDDAAMMQALGCRPQGDQMPVFPREATPVSKSVEKPAAAAAPAGHALRP